MKKLIFLIGLTIIAQKGELYATSNSPINEEKSNPKPITNVNNDSSALNGAPQNRASNAPYVLSESEMEEIDQELSNINWLAIDQNQLDNRRNEVLRDRAAYEVAGSQIRAFAPDIVERISGLIRQLDNATVEERARLECELDLAINSLNREEFNSRRTELMNRERARLNKAEDAIPLAKTLYRDEQLRFFREFNHYAAADQLINNRLASLEAHETGEKIRNDYADWKRREAAGRRNRKILLASTVTMAACSILLIYHYMNAEPEAAKSNESSL